MSEKAKYKYPEGIYILEVLSNTLAKNDRQTYIVLSCKVVAMKKGDSKHFEAGKLRTVNLWTTEAAIERTKDILKAAQFPENTSAARLQKDHPEHISLAGFQFDASCRHNDRGYDEFSALPVGNGGGNSKWMDELPKPATSDIMKLDDMFGIAAPKSNPTPAAAGARKARW